MYLSGTHLPSAVIFDSHFCLLPLFCFSSFKLIQKNTIDFTGVG